MIENTVVGTDSKENQQLKTCYDHIFYVGWFNIDSMLINITKENNK